MVNEEHTESFERPQTKVEMYEIVCFNLAKEELGFEITKVKEIIKPPQITRVPNSNEFIDGVINLRGRIIPVINLRKKLNFESRIIDSNSRIIVADTGIEQVGFVVDRVNHVVWVDRSREQSQTKAIGGINAEYINSVYKSNERLVTILNPDKLLYKN